MRVRTLANIGLFGALTAAASAARAQTVDAANPASMVTALQSAGYKALLSKDSSGDPKIESAANGGNFTVFFYGCEANKDCKSVQLSAGYKVKQKSTIDKMNEWNQKNRFATAYIDTEGDPCIQFDIVLVGGMPPKLFAETLSRWTDAMGSFQTFIDW